MNQKYSRGQLVINKFLKRNDENFYGIICSYNSEMDAYLVMFLFHFQFDGLLSEIDMQYWFSEDIEECNLSLKELRCEPFLVFKYQDENSWYIRSPYSIYSLFIEAGFNRYEHCSINEKDFNLKQITNGDFCKLIIPYNNKEIIGIAYNPHIAYNPNKGNSWYSGLYFIYVDENNKIIWSIVSYFELEPYNYKDKINKNLVNIKHYKEWCQKENFRFLQTRQYINSLRDYIKNKLEVKS